MPETPVETVYDAVAEAEQVEVADLPSLERWVHPATLDALTGPWKQLDRSLEFRYVWYHVTVHSNGKVRVRG